MADYRISDAALNAELQYIIDNCDRQVAVSADPVNYAGVAAVTLAATAMIGGDFSIVAGLISGRRLQIGAKTGVTPTANGNGSHILLVDDTNNDILLMVPIPTTPLSTGVSTAFGPWEHEARGNEAA